MKNIQHIYMNKTTRQLVEILTKRCQDGFCLNKTTSWPCERCPLVKKSISLWGIDVVSLGEE